MTERATRALNSTNRLVHAAITRLAPIVLARSRVQDKADARLGQLAAGYRGDSILNSLSDTAMMSTGFFVASCLRARYVVAIALAFEIFTACMIRDNLTLNVINLIAPSDWAPIKAIHDWQAGAKH